MNKTIIILILVVLSWVGVYIIVDSLHEEKESITYVKNEEIENDQCLGYIEGPLSYPSEKIPEGMYICARNLETQYEYCTDKQIIDSKFRYEKGYRLEVPIGNYYVAGFYPWMTDTPMQEFKYAECDPKEEDCSTMLSVVSVGCDELTENIDLFNWGKFNFFKRFNKDTYIK